MRTMNRKAPVFGDVLESVGGTPLVEVRGMETGPCRLFLKLENQNPGGSIKDRIGKSMIEAAEKDGRLKPGGVIVEATAGNTGLGLALVAARKGYRLILVIPDKMSQEKVFHLKALGAEVRMTRSDVVKGHPEYYQDMAARIAAESGGFYVNQFENPANPKAHETTTAPEIWSQTGRKLDAVVCGIGSGGTITGLSRFFAREAPHVELVLADPEGSILAPYVRTGVVPSDVGSWLVEGIGEDFLPPIADLSRVRKAYTVSDRESFDAARELLRREGIMAGSSSGTLLAAALRYCRESDGPKRVVTFVCDSGNKYLTKMYNDFWMGDQGFLDRPLSGDLRDLISRRHHERATVFAAPGDTLLSAFGKMKLYDVSQLPVIEADRPVGMIDEMDILLQVYRDESRFKDPVRGSMASHLETIQADAPLEDLVGLFRKGLAAVVFDGKDFLGIITPIDLVNHLRRRIK